MIVQDNKYNTGNNKDIDFFSLLEKQARARFRALIANPVFHSIIEGGAVIEYTYPARPHNFAWCRICDDKEQVIRFQLIECFRILHINSFFHWRKQVLRRYWMIFDADTDIKHVHTQNRAQQKTEAAGAAA
jgi:hypothetical protein